MPGFEILRTQSFRLTCISGAAFALCSLILFGLIYSEVEIYETNQIGRFVEGTLKAIGEGDTDAAIARLTQAQSATGESDASFGLFAPSGVRLSGTMRALPHGLEIDGQARRFDQLLPRGDGDGPIYAAGQTLADGRILVIARNVGEIDQLRLAVLRALEIGVAPALVLSLGLGFFLSLRSVRRVRALHQTIERIMRGNLRERLVLDGADDFDRLSGSVNRMLDQIETLLDEIKGVGDDIAHDLRTPLTRVRTRLERAKQQATSIEELIEAIDGGIVGLDQALGIITALMRIGEIEDGRRRAAFGDVDVSALARDIAELYEPIAEGEGVTLSVEEAGRLSVFGDRDLLIEAMANIVDNAIKFTPQGGHVSIVTAMVGDRIVIRVTDSGSGIPVEERAAVLKRFYRSDKSRQHQGSGLGLGVVQAIASLHEIEIAIGDATPGCVFELRCRPARSRGWQSDPRAPETRI